MNDAAPNAASPPPFGGVALWQAADTLLREVFHAPFDFWAYCEQWQPVLERSRTFCAPPVHARLQQGELLCARIATTGRAECCEWDEGRMLVGVPLAEHGHLHLVALGEIATLSPEVLLEIATEFARRWAQREAEERLRDAEWQRAVAAARAN
jgi:hypothetical protein